MKYQHLLLFVITLIFAQNGLCNQGDQVDQSAPTTDLTAKDASLKNIEKIEKAATGYRFTEGPACDKKGNIHFTDIPNQHIILYDTTKTKASIEKKETGRDNGLMFDHQHRLVACAGGSRQLIRYEKDGTTTVLAKQYKGKKLNSPNDLDIDAKGGIYFTDPRYGNTKNMEMKVMGVYYYSPAGKLARVIDDLVRPNGLILSLDNKILYVSDADGKTIYAYDTLPDGSLKNKRIFAKVPPQHRRAADGMTIDQKGNIYGACVDGIRIWNPKGKLIQIIPIPEIPSNCTFGGANHDWLYITAQKSLYRIKMAVKGKPILYVGRVTAHVGQGLP